MLTRTCNKSQLIWLYLGDLEANGDQVVERIDANEDRIIAAISGKLKQIYSEILSILIQSMQSTKDFYFVLSVMEAELRK